MDQDSALDALSALSQETRLQVFRMLVQAGPEGLTAGAIAERLAVRPNTLSTHLAVLLAAGLLHKRRSGRTIIYSADYDGMRALLAYLVEDCCGGNPAICAPFADVTCAAAAR